MINPNSVAILLLILAWFSTSSPNSTFILLDFGLVFNKMSSCADKIFIGDLEEGEDEEVQFLHQTSEEIHSLQGNGKRKRPIIMESQLLQLENAANNEACPPVVLTNLTWNNESDPGDVQGLQSDNEQ